MRFGFIFVFAFLGCCDVSIDASCKVGYKAKASIFYSVDTLEDVQCQENEDCVSLAIEFSASIISGSAIVGKCVERSTDLECCSTCYCNRDKLMELVPEMKNVHVAYTINSCVQSCGQEEILHSCEECSGA